MCTFNIHNGTSILKTSQFGKHRFDSFTKIFVISKIQKKFIQSLCELIIKWAKYQGLNFVEFSKFLTCLSNNIISRR